MPSLADIDIHLFALKQDRAANSDSLAASPGALVHKLDITNADLRPFDVSMEQLGQLLAAQPRCYFEWDGSFVWTGEEDGSAWTLSGMIYDCGNQISRVELRGTAPERPVQQIVRWLQLPPRELACQHMDSGMYSSGLELEKLWNA